MKNTANSMRIKPEHQYRTLDAVDLTLYKNRSGNTVAKFKLEDVDHLPDHVKQEILSRLLGEVITQDKSGFYVDDIDS